MKNNKKILWVGITFLVIIVFFFVIKNNSGNHDQYGNIYGSNLIKVRNMHHGGE